MSLLSRIAALLLFTASVPSALAAEPKVISEKRQLTNSDLGKVFIAEGLTPHPNFGKYKVLLSTETKGWYAFETFDLVNGEPIGKFIVSHPAEPIYREVLVDPDLMKKAKIEIQKSNAKLGELLRQQMNDKR